MDKLTISRRGFIVGSASLSFALVVTPRSLRAAADSNAVFAPNAVLRIAADNTVRIYMPHADLGSGIYTGLAQILAEELDADWNRVVAEHLDSLDADFQHQQWGVIATGASTSINNQWQHFRETGASARAMLIAAAAQHWGVAADRLSAQNSRVIDADNERAVSYGALSAIAATLTPPESVTLKDPAAFKLIGHSVPRLDRKSKSEGSATFGADVRLPDMLHAVVRHAPVFGGKLASFNATAAEAMPGVRAVVEIPTGVAVVADSFWQAKKAIDSLKIRWDHGAFASVSSSDLWRDYDAMAATPGQVFERRGKIDFAAANGVLEGEMRFPFLAHAPMEPLNATAQVRGDACEVWAGTQFQGFDVANLEQATGIKADKITIHTQWLGGSFGRRAAPQADFLVEAVQIAQASGLPNPIKMMWQREDDIQGGLYRPMALHRFKVGVDRLGQPAHWQHRVVCASITKGTPMEAGFHADGFDRLSVEGLIETHYAGANVDFQLHSPEYPVPVCWLRGEADTHTAPVVESIINRLARMSGADPFTYRYQLLTGKDKASRVVGVLRALESAARWADAPPAEVYRGMAVHASFGSVCGFVVELKKAGTQLDFHRVTAAFDCGLVINPDSVRAQVYSGVAFALSTVLGQKIEIDRGGAAQSNFHDYAVARLRQVPDVDVHLVDNGLDHPTGVGEVAVPPFIPALAEAVHAATGQEVNEFPLVLDGYHFGAV